MISPLIPKSDWLLISHYSITLESNVKVMRIIEIVTNFRSFRLSNNFSISLPLKIWRDQCSEYQYYCLGVKGQTNSPCQCNRVNQDFCDLELCDNVVIWLGNFCSILQLQSLKWEPFLAVSCFIYSEIFASVLCT